LSQQTRPECVERTTKLGRRARAGSVAIQKNDIVADESVTSVTKRFTGHALDAIPVDGAACPLLGDRQSEPSGRCHAGGCRPVREHGPVAIGHATVVAEDRIVGTAIQQPRFTRETARMEDPAPISPPTNAPINTSIVVTIAVRTVATTVTRSDTPPDARLVDGSIHGGRIRRRHQALRRARPLRRRAAKTARPPRVASRARNPWVRARLILLG